MPEIMDRIGQFVERVEECLEGLDLGEDTVFFLEGGAEYSTLEGLQKTAVPYRKEYDQYPHLSINIKSRAFRVFVKDEKDEIDEEAVIISKLSSPKCCEIVRKFKECILSVNSETKSVDEKSRIVQAFYKYTKEELMIHEDDWSVSEIETLLEAVEQFLLQKFHSLSVLSDDQLQDEIMIDKIERLPKEEIESFGGLDGSGTIDWDRCLEQEATPKQKLLFIQSRIKDMAAAENSDADAIVSCLLAEIIQSKPRSLISNLRFIQRFRNRWFMTGEAAYTMTMLLAVIQHIDQVVGNTPGQSKLLYSLVAGSTSSLSTTTAMASRSDEEVSFVSRQVNELNTMASSVFSSIGFVPRAIGAAVVDTFRSRAASGSTLSLKKSSGQEDEERRKEADQLSTFRRRIIETDNIESMTISEIRQMLLDYKQLLSTAGPPKS